MRVAVGATLAASVLVLALASPAIAQPGILCVQTELNALGFNAGPADGAIGARTRQAAEQYRLWMSGGAGPAGWNEPALTALNGETWCAKIAADHPEVASLAPQPVEVTYSASGSGGLVASFDLPFKGVVTDWHLRFAYKTECENDNWASITAPGGQTEVFMDRGSNRCSGRPATFTGRNDNDPPLMGVRANGRWRIVFKDLDANFYSTFVTQVKLTLTVANDGVTRTQTVTFDELPKEVPSPT
jgi:hypothetical protein